MLCTKHCWRMGIDFHTVTVIAVFVCMYVYGEETGGGGVGVAVESYIAHVANTHIKSGHEKKHSHIILL